MSGTSVRRTADVPLLIKGSGRLGEDVLHPFLEGGHDFRDRVAPLFYRREVRSHGVIVSCRARAQVPQVLDPELSEEPQALAHAV